ncbi:hypothetical protein GCM10022224_082520 [Nonomuraea antimicrobica]|uniref:Uncharacterized protein n=1 Tax=Nonomuraea antimicrobica TaxID=561173 RepID=A0ABP7DEC1_9ACTN
MPGLEMILIMLLDAEQRNVPIDSPLLPEKMPGVGGDIPAAGGAVSGVAGAGRGLRGGRVLAP